MNDLIDAWNIHNRINLFLLNAIDVEHLHDRAGGKGRTVGEQFAHLHNVRLMWCKAALPELLEGIAKIEKNEAGDAATLQSGLEASGKAIADLLAHGLESGRIKGFKPHPSAFAGYLIAHEAHHRGQITLTLKLCGHTVDKKTSYGMWEWGVR